jgi:hypothetical protein
MIMQENCIQHTIKVLLLSQEARGTYLHFCRFLKKLHFSLTFDTQPCSRLTKYSNMVPTVIVNYDGMLILLSSNNALCSNNAHVTM